MCEEDWNGLNVIVYRTNPNSITRNTNKKFVRKCTRLNIKEAIASKRTTEKMLVMTHTDKGKSEAMIIPSEKHKQVRNPGLLASIVCGLE
jgi:predicted phosphohydrolase